MTTPGHPEGQVEVDLTANPLESTPGEEGHGRGIYANLDVSLVWKFFRVAVGVHDKSERMADSVYFLMMIVAVVIPTVVVFGICAVAGAPMIVTLISSFTTLGIFTFIALKLGHGRRRHAEVDQTRTLRSRRNDKALKPKNRAKSRSAKRKRQPLGRR